MTLNKVLLRSVCAGALGGLLFGFDTAVIAGTTHALTVQFGLSPLQLGLTVSIALWGTVLGALVSGPVGQSVGSRVTLRCLALLYIVSALGCALAWNWQALLAARFIGGIAIGGSSVLGPVYIAELAPPSLRGRMVGTFQINIVGGILLAYLSNFLIARMQFGAAEWRWDFGVCAFPSLLFFLMLFGTPHSARWLVTKGRTKEALEALSVVGVAEPEAELKRIVDATRSEHMSHEESLFRFRYRFPILLAILLALFNQLSGINAVLYYLNDIFTSAGFSRIAGGTQTVVVGTVNLLATLLAMSLIDKFGRRTLLLVGTAGMTISLASIAYIFAKGSGRELLIYLIAFYIASFAISSGSVVWVYMSEIFPSMVRVKGQALGSTVLWIANGIVSQAFPWLAARSAAFPFVFFAGATAANFVVTAFLFPETRGLSLEDLEKKMGVSPEAFVPRPELQ